MRVEVTSTAPGASTICPASSWVLPWRGTPIITTQSSVEQNTRCRPTRHSCTATSVGDSVASCLIRAQMLGGVSDGRTIGAWRRIARTPAERAMSSVEATPALRRDEAPHRVTVVNVDPRRCQTHPTRDRADRGQHERVGGLEQRQQRQQREHAEPERPRAGAASPRDPRRDDRDNTQDQDLDVHDSPPKPFTTCSPSPLSIAVLACWWRPGCGPGAGGPGTR